jgi:hypothetical protein
VPPLLLVSTGEVVVSAGPNEVLLVVGLGPLIATGDCGSEQAERCASERRAE